MRLRIVNFVLRRVSADQEDNHQAHRDVQIFLPPKTRLHEISLEEAKGLRAELDAQIKQYHGYPLEINLRCPVDFIQAKEEYSYGLHTSQYEVSESPERPGDGERAPGNGQLGKSNDSSCRE